LIPQSLDVLSGDHIQKLVEGAIEEGPTLEFKRDLPAADRDSRKEFIADVCAMANSRGGDIVFGIEEGVDGGAQDLAPLTIDADSVITQLSNVLADGLEPRLHGVQMKAVAVEGGKVLVLRVPRSFSGIHRSTRDAHFWVRESRSKRQLDVAGITARMAEVLGREDRLLDFFARRYAAIATGRYPLPTGIGPKVVLHILPPRDFLRGEEADLRAVQQSGTFFLMPRHRSGLATYTLDGILHHHPVDERTGSLDAGTLVFRSGAVEAFAKPRVVTLADDEPAVMVFEHVEQMCVGFLQEALPSLATDLRLGWPLVVRIGIVGHEDICASTANQDVRWSLSHIPAIRVPQAVVQLPDLVLEALPRSLPLALRPAFDRLWQAWGYPRSYSYQQRADGAVLWQRQEQPQPNA
jgi:hypothetical protein